MIKGLAIIPPILGRISIGKIGNVVEKDAQFTIIPHIQGKEGWVILVFLRVFYLKRWRQLLTSHSAF